MPVGGAKAFGYGAVSLKIGALHAIPNKKGAPTPSLGDFAASFVKTMEAHARNWQNSARIRLLKAMADPDMADKNADMLAAMTLDPSASPPRNDFKGKNKLPEYRCE
jgi:hypothetical protein